MNVLLIQNKIKKDLQAVDRLLSLNYRNNQIKQTVKFERLLQY